MALLAAWACSMTCDYDATYVTPWPVRDTMRHIAPVMLRVLYDMRIASSVLCLRRVVAALLATLAVAAAPTRAHAQIRPSIDAEFFVQWPTMDSDYINSGGVHGSIGISAPLLQRRALAWVVSGQLTGMVAGIGENADCIIVVGQPGCAGHQDVLPTGALLTGAAFHEGPLVLRLQAGAARFTREFGSPKIGPQLRLDGTVLARGTVGVTISASRAWIGEYLGQQLGMTSLGVGIRLVPRR